MPAASGASTIVGRADDLRGVAACFERGARVVTIVGAGGMGKTRLATQLLAERGAEYTGHGSGGAWWCELTEARSATAVCAVIASALGLRLDAIVDEARVVARLGASLARRKRMLLVLDNCEHIAAEVAGAVRAWLAAAPHLRVLATSRVPLGLAAEQQWPLGAIAEAAAIELFVERARQQRPAFAATAEERAAIADIVNRLDRIPLAIELAAARSRTMSAQQILARVERPLELLALRGVVLDSYRLLPERTRACFVGCAVFHGGFTLAAAEHVLAAPDRNVCDELDLLCQHSLLRVVPAATAVDAAPRFHLFEMMREVARELAAGADAAAALADRHAQYFVKLATGLRDRHAAGDEAALDELEAELENLVAAHGHALTRDARAAYALVLALDPLLAKRGLFRLRLRLLDATLGAAASGRADAASHAPDDGDRVRALLARGATHRELGDLALAQRDVDAARTLAARTGDAAAEAIATMRLGVIDETAGDTAAARRAYERGLAVLATAAPGRATDVLAAELHAHLGHALRRENQLAAADAEVARAIELYRGARDREGTATVAYEAAVVAMFRGDTTLARAWFDDALALARAVGARQLEAAIVTGRGLLVQEQGALDEAIAAHAAAVQVFRDLGNRHREASALYYLAGAYLERGDAQQADGLLEQSALHALAVGASRYVALIRGLQSVVHAVRGRAELARRAADAADLAAAACTSEPGVLASLRIHRLHLGPLDDAAIHTARAEVAATTNDDTRFALRLLETRLRLRRTPDGRALVIADDGATFRVPDAPAAVDLSRRAPLRRILAALARRRSESPGETLGLDDLLEAGWPGERISHEAAVNRVHVALATLRKLGLRDVLVTSERGYLLAPTVPLELVASAGA